jgi:ABC-2 type transport system permease protein
VGAATGSRAFALAAGSAVAVVGFLGFAVSGLSDALSWMGEVSPWQWYVDSQPLSGGPTSSSLGLPLLITTLLVAAGVLVLDRRDLR